MCCEKKEKNKKTKKNKKDFDQKKRNNIVR